MHVSNNKIEIMQQNITRLNQEINNMQQFHLIKGSLNLTADSKHNQTTKQWSFSWPQTNTNCVCPNASIIDGRIWYDLYATNCNCTIDFFDDRDTKFVDNPQLLFNTYSTADYNRPGLSASMLGDYMIYRKPEKPPLIPRCYVTSMTVMNTNVKICFGNNNIDLWQIVDWYAFGYIRK